MRVARVIGRYGKREEGLALGRGPGELLWYLTFASLESVYLSGRGQYHRVILGCYVMSLRPVVDMEFCQECHARRMYFKNGCSGRVWKDLSYLGIRSLQCKWLVRKRILQ